jgi:hypothetical protein
MERLSEMPRDGAIIFGDLIGKLEVLRIECAKCGRSGRYRLADLIMRYGRDEKLFAFTADASDPARSATGYVAEKLGRRWLAFDQNREYVRGSVGWFLSDNDIAPQVMRWPPRRTRN